MQRRRRHRDSPVIFSRAQLRLALVTLCAGGGGNPASLHVHRPSFGSFWPPMMMVMAAEDDAAGTSSPSSSSASSSLTVRRSLAEEWDSNTDRNKDGADDKAAPSVMAPLSLLQSQTPFSEGWIKGLVTDKAGCSDWRTVGYAWMEDGTVVSNMNNVVETWVYAIAGRQRENLVIVDDSGYFDGIVCREQSKGRVERGGAASGNPFRTSAFIAAMRVRSAHAPPHIPHAHLLETILKEWSSFMRSKGASELDVESSTGVTFENVRSATRNNVEDWLRGFGVDQFGATELLCRLFLWNHVQPWLKTDMRNLILTSPDCVRKKPFIALNVASGPSDSGNLRAPIPVEVYLSRARLYFERLSESESEFQASLASIRGIWVTTDDPSVVEEVRNLAPAFFPGVGKGDGKVFGWAEGKNDKKRALGEDKLYRRLTYDLTDLLQLSRAEVLIGVSSSGTDNVAGLLRAGGGKPRESRINVDIY